MNNLTVEQVVKKLDLKPHPEGGFYTETYRSAIKLGNRSIATEIYFLQTPEGFSSFHMLKSAHEVWHFYSGDPIDLVLISKEGKAQHVMIGSDLSNGQVPQYIVSPGTWFGSRLSPGGKWGLVGCTVTPAFEFSDFVIGKRADLLKQYPQAKAEIMQLTRE